jgi:hypothetical protein
MKVPSLLFSLILAVTLGTAGCGKKPAGGTAAGPGGPIKAKLATTACTCGETCAATCASCERENETARGTAAPATATKGK